MLIRLYLLLAVIFWGWSFVFTKIMLDYVDPAELMGLRFIIGLPILYFIIVIKKIKLKIDTSDYLPLGGGFLVITLHFFIQITGLKYTSATNTGWIIAVTPLVLAVISFFVHKEKIGYKGVIGIIIATAGILLLVSKGKLNNLDWLESVGDWLILASAFTWSIYTVITRNISRKYHPLAVTFSILLPSSMIFIIYMIITSDWSVFIHLPIKPLWSLIALGVLCLAVAHWFWQEGIAGIGAAKSGIFLYLEPLSTTFLAIPILQEKFTLFTGIGGLLVLLGVYIAEMKKFSRNSN